MPRSQTTEERGAYLIELVIALPIFFAFIFFIVFLAIQISTIITFGSSVNNAVRLGASRGDRIAMGFQPSNASSGLIGALHSPSFWSPETKNLLCHRVPEGTCESYYNSWSQRIHQLPFASLPRESIYSIVYALEGIRLSTGDGAVRFPCNPLGDGQGDIGGGCLDCQALSPDSYGAVPSSKLRTVLECSFQPDSFVFRILMSLSGGASGSSSPVLSRRMFFDRSVFR